MIPNFFPHPGYRPPPPLAPAPVGDGPFHVALDLRPRTPLPTLAELSASPPAAPLRGQAYEDRHGADDRDVAAVVDFAARNSLTVVQVAKGPAKVVVSGLRADLERCFALAMEAHHDHAGKVVVHSGVPTVPAELTGVVTGMTGPDHRPVVSGAPLAFWPVGANLADQGVPEPRPRTSLEYARLYDYPRLDGAGQTIGLIQLAGSYDRADLDAYFKALGISPEVVDANPPQESDPLSNLEVTTGIEIVAPICPAARIVNYFASPADYSFSAYYRAFEAAIFDEKYAPAVISTSWTFPEEISDIGIGKAWVDRFNALFVKAAIRGVTLCSSAGNLGSQVPFMLDGRFGAATLPVPSFPASSPFVIGCGGTTLYAGADRIEREVVWNRLGEVLDLYSGTAHIQMAGFSSSGGVSRLNPCPSFQSGVEVPPAVTFRYDNGKLSLVSRTHGRGVPDVAANADLWLGYRLYFDGAWGTTGGTSASAPMWAALLTLINQGLGRHIGYVLPLLYRLHTDGPRDAFRSITEGFNGAFQAHGDGRWNPCTGLGSPDGTRLLAALAAIYGLRPG